MKAGLLAGSLTELVRMAELHHAHVSIAILATAYCCVYFIEALNAEELHAETVLSGNG
jgi:hypothetical protein